ncbi:hypothetical protein BH11PLA2_BH11PLA2_51570 [soil metagenome]
MSTRLSRFQTAMLGLCVLVTLAVGGVGLAAIAAKDRLWADTFELNVALPDAADVTPGTPVRLRGVEAGHVVLIQYPASDATGSSVLLCLKLDGKFRGRLYNDATAKVVANGIMGSKVISLQPGTAASGELVSNTIVAMPTVDLAVAAEKLTKVADEAEKLLRDARTGNGTLGKLVTDDTLYRELTSLATDARAATGKVEKQADKVEGLVADGKETLKSVRQGTDALQKMPIVRNYVENANTLLVRPECRKESYDYNSADLFEPNTAILTEAGRGHLERLAGLLKSFYSDPAKAKMDVVVAVLVDPADKSLTAGAAQELSRKQAEVVAEALKEQKVHKTNLWHRNRTVTPIGLGTGPSPITDTVALPAARVQVVVFWPS